MALARDHGATAVLLTAGALRAAVDEVGDLGIIMRIDATLSHMGGPDTIMHLLHNAEEAAALGADMVVLNCYVGIGDVADRVGPAEEAGHRLRRVRADRHAALRRDHPPGPYEDPAQKMPTSADLAMAIRLGLEYGCDMVKTVYNGDPEGYAKAVASGHLPVIMAGGPKSDELAIFRQLHEAMTHGASGGAIGAGFGAATIRRPRSGRSARSCAHGATADEAIAIYRQGKGVDPCWRQC